MSGVTIDLDATRTGPWIPSVADRHTDVAVKSFYERGFWTEAVLTDFVDRFTAERGGDVVASDGYGALTWAELQSQAYRLAARLRGMGVDRGDRVVVQLPNWNEFLVAYVALARIGAVLVPVMMIYRDDEVAYIASFAEAKGIITTGEFRKFDHLAMVRGFLDRCPSLSFVVAARAEPAAGELAFAELVSGDGVPAAEVLGPAPSPDDGHLCIFTSGTESRPKGCYHTFNTLGASVRALTAALGIRAGDVTFMPSPISHATGLAVGMTTPLLTGTATHLLDVWEPAAGLARIAEHRCTNTVTAAPFVQMALDAFDPAVHDMTSMRAWGCGGAPVPPSMVERAAQLWPGCHLQSLYGRSEVFLTTICGPDDPLQRSVSSDGRPPEMVELAVDDEGEILQRGAGTMLGYFNDPDRTATTFDADGWCRSGDLGRLDDAGYLRVTGRSKDIIIRGGSNISAREVEDHLLAHDKVKDAALVAMPDPVLGERACAYVVPNPDMAPPTLAELAGFLRDDRRISVTKLPERLELIDALPVTATGKVQKFMLRDRIRETLAAEQ